MNWQSSKIRVATGVGVLFVLALGSAACHKSSPQATAVGSKAATSHQAPTFSPHERALIERLSPLGKPPTDETNAVATDPRAARLGQYLFFDKRISANGKVSCSSCHQPSHGFTMPAPLGKGLASTPRNPPSLLDVAFHHWYDWDGHADTMWAQAFGPMESSKEMGFSRSGLAHLIYTDKDLHAAYVAIFGKLPDLSDTTRFPADAKPVAGQPDNPQNKAWAAMRSEDRDAVNRIASNATKAIAAYQTRLVRGHAPFDTFVEGLKANDPQKIAALNPAAQRGLKLFMGKGGCVRCHSGPTFTDESFHNLGLGPRPWLDPNDEGRWKGVDMVKQDTFNAAGAYSDNPHGKRAQWLEFLTRTPEDHGQFKTPSLRNVALSSPYMHGGHFNTLEEVVRFYSTLNEQGSVGHREDMLKPLSLTDAEIGDVVAFLKSLTGKPLPARLTRQPDSPLLEQAAR